MSEKPRIWSFDRKTEVATVDRNVRREDYRQLCYVVVDAVLEVRETGHVLDRHVQAFVEALQCSNEYVFCAGGRRLAQCSHFDETCSRKMQELMEHPKWRVRFNAVAVTDYNPPESLLLGVLRLGLVDTSKRVRSLAVGKILARRTEALIPDLEQCLRDEKDEESRAWIRDAVRLIRGEPVVREGLPITLEQAENGTYRLVCRGRGGNVYQVLSSVQSRPRQTER